MARRATNQTVILLALLLSGGTAAAQGVREFLDSIDMNDYALGFFYYQSQSPYSGVDDFRIVYPITTSFEHATATNDAYFVRDGNIGLRVVTDNGWSYGVIGNIQTLGYGTGDSEALDGMFRRSWTVQAGAVVGKRFGPISADIFSTTDIFNEHNGYDVAFKLAVPLGNNDIQVVPQVEAIYQSDKLLNHYFGVRAIEATQGRPEYAPGSAVTYAASVDLAYRFHPNWYLSGSIAIDFLPSEIQNSPIVGRETTARVSLGIAYDSRAFARLNESRVDSPNSFVEASVAAFFVSAKASINLVSAQPFDLQQIDGVQRIDESIVVWPVDLAWQFGRWHRLDLRYYQLRRTGTTTADFPIQIGNITFPAGETLATDFTTQIVRLGYSFSLFRDEQKDVAIFGGISLTDIDYRVRGDTESIDAQTSSVLPVLGATARINFTKKIAVDAGLEIFALDFNDKNGELIDIRISGVYELSPHFFIGAGFQFFRQNISSADDTFAGDYRVDYRGPLVFVRARL